MCGVQIHYCCPDIYLLGMSGGEWVEVVRFSEQFMLVHLFWLIATAAAAVFSVCLAMLLFLLLSLPFRTYLNLNCIYLYICWIVNFHSFAGCVWLWCWLLLLPPPMTDWLVACLVRWLVGWLAHWLACLPACLAFVGWLAGFLVCMR